MGYRLDWGDESEAGGMAGGYTEGQTEGQTDGWAIKNQSMEIEFKFELDELTGEEKEKQEELMALLFGMTVEELRDLTQWVREAHMLEKLTGEVWHLV